MPTRTTSFSKEKGAALGGTRTHDTLLSRKRMLIPGQLSKQCSKSTIQHNTRQDTPNSKLNDKSRVQGKCIAIPTRTTSFSKEKGAALGGTRTHDTLLSRQSALPRYISISKKGYYTTFIFCDIVLQSLNAQAPHDGRQQH